MSTRQPARRCGFVASLWVIRLPAGQTQGYACCQVTLKLPPEPTADGIARVVPCALTIVIGVAPPSELSGAVWPLIVAEAAVNGSVPRFDNVPDEGPLDDPLRTRSPVRR